MFPALHLNSKRVAHGCDLRTARTARAASEPQLSGPNPGPGNQQDQVQANM